MQSQAESSSSVSVLLCQDSEHFQFPYDVFTDDASTRKCPVLLLLLWSQRSPSSLLLRGVAIVVQFLEPLIAFVAYTLYRSVYDEVAALEEFKIVLSSLANSDTEDLAGLERDDQL